MVLLPHYFLVFEAVQVGSLKCVSPRIDNRKSYNRTSCFLAALQIREEIWENVFKVSSLMFIFSRNLMEISRFQTFEKHVGDHIECSMYALRM